MKTRTRFLALTVVVLGMLLLPAAAFAYTPTGGDFITCASGDAEEDVACVAGVFEANTDCTFETSTGASGTGVTNADGEVSFSFDPPGDEGDINATVQCGTKVLSDTVANVTEDGNVVDTEGEVIAVAGSDAALLAVGALGAIALGGAALFASRRKRTTTSA